jgi:DNA-binding HxlR family transcriptional regulator
VVPPFVEYSLTPLGEEVAERVASMADWIELNLPRVMAAQEKVRQKSNG